MYCIYLKNLRQIIYLFFENDLMLIYLCIYSFIYLFVYLLMYLFMYLFVCIFDNLFIHLFIVCFLKFFMFLKNLYCIWKSLMLVFFIHSFSRKA